MLTDAQIDLLESYAASIERLVKALREAQESITYADSITSNAIKATMRDISNVHLVLFGEPLQDFETKGKQSDRHNKNFGQPV